MRKLVSAIAIMVISVVAFSGCGDGLKGESFSVDSLEGSYQIQSECTAEFDGVEATLDGCVLEDLFGYPPITVETGTVVFQEETITVDASTYYEVDSPCYGDVRADIAVSGELTKTEGDETGGPFSALAGKWSGTLEAAESAPPYELIDGAPADCEPFEGDEVTHSTDVQAHVMGDTMEVTTSEGQFSIISGEDEITVDGTTYQKQ